MKLKFITLKKAIILDFLRRYKITGKERIKYLKQYNFKL